METNDKKNKSKGKAIATCDSCGKSFNICIPNKPGKYKMNCPHCSKQISLTFSESKLNEFGKMAKKLAAPRIKAPILGKPEKVKDRVYAIKTLAIINRPYRVVCPECGTDVPLLSSIAGKPIKARCKKCHALVFFKADEKKVSTETNDRKKIDKKKDAKSEEKGEPEKRKTIKIAVPNGAVSWRQGKGILGKTRIARLREGSNTIGRKDDTSPSDIMIERDDEISRRSILIDVVYNTDFKGFTYELKVLRSTNPVYVNGRPMGIDEVVRLNYNDIICLGKTNVTFIQIDKKK